MLYLYDTCIGSIFFSFTLDTLIFAGISGLDTDLDVGLEAQLEKK